MVIGEKFIWMHIGKTGGDATHAYFSYFKNILKLEIDDTTQHRKHQALFERGVNHEGKLLILNIRRLPYFILSQVHHHSMQNKIDFVNDIIYSLEKTINGYAIGTLANYYINFYTKNGSLKIDRWFRCEYLLDDFADFIMEYVDIPRDKLITKLSKIPTKVRLVYALDLNYYWEPKHLKLMYENNPLWTVIEEQCYGNLLC